MADPQYKACIDACRNCIEACDACAVACLQELDAPSRMRCIALNMDCAQICHLVASYLSRGRELAAILCQVCAEICDMCSDECALHPVRHCQDCAQACQQCAYECRRIVSAMQSGRYLADERARVH
jgi:hypothetical protein